MSLSHASFLSAVFTFNSFVLIPRIPQQQLATQRRSVPSQVVREAREENPWRRAGRSTRPALLLTAVPPRPLQQRTLSPPGWGLRGARRGQCAGAGPSSSLGPASPPKAPDPARLAPPLVPAAAPGAWRARVRRRCSRALCSVRCLSNTSIRTRTRWAEGRGGVRHRFECGPASVPSPPPLPGSPPASSPTPPQRRPQPPGSGFSRSRVARDVAPAR